MAKTMSDEVQRHVELAKRKAREYDIKFYVTRESDGKLGVVSFRPVPERLEAECYPNGRTVWRGGME